MWFGYGDGLHTSATVTLDTYADLFDADRDAVAVTLHANYSRENVLKMCSRAAHESPQQTPK